MASEESVIDWLLDGDPAIRWQVMRDLLDEPAEVWERERRRTVESGWVAELLGRRAAGRRVAEGTLDGFHLDAAAARRLRAPRKPSGRTRADRASARSIHACRTRVDGAFLLKRVDLCHLGFWLGLGGHFVGADPRLPPLGEAVLSAQLDDGGWNCQMRNRPSTRHSSFHTTFNVLENLRIAAARGIVPERAFRDAEMRAAEFMLSHRLYRSDRTGQVISERFTHLTYPWHWHYTVLRGLDYLRLTPAISDERLADPIDLLREKRKPNGRWPLQKRIPGTLLVEMEKPGTDSRWNTLRALRVLRLRDNHISAAR